MDDSFVPEFRVIQKAVFSSWLPTTCFRLLMMSLQSDINITTIVISGRFIPND